MTTTNEPPPGGADTIDSEDVVELILADHREFERLLRELRDRSSDRATVLARLSDLLVAHAEAEEDEVYPNLERRVPDEAEEIAHGEQEHADGHVALLALQRTDPHDADAFEEALEELSETVTHHLDEEERDVLNAAREEVAEDVRAQLGRAFRERRTQLLRGRPGDPDNVERLVEDARGQGLVDD